MKQDLNNLVHQLEQKIQRIERQIADQRSSSVDQSPEGKLPFVILSSSSSFLYSYLSNYETYGRRKSS